MAMYKDVDLLKTFDFETLNKIKDEVNLLSSNYVFFLAPIKNMSRFKELVIKRLIIERIGYDSLKNNTYLNDYCNPLNEDLVILGVDSASTIFIITSLSSLLKNSAIDLGG